MNNYNIIITVTICADETQGLITCDLYTWNKRRLKRNSVARRTMPNSNVKHVYGSINDCQRNIFSVRYTRLCDYRYYYYCLFFLFYGSILFWFFFFFRGCPSCLFFNSSAITIFIIVVIINMGSGSAGVSRHFC